MLEETLHHHHCFLYLWGWAAVPCSVAGWLLHFVVFFGRLPMRLLALPVRFRLRTAGFTNTGRCADDLLLFEELSLLTLDPEDAYERAWFVSSMAPMPRMNCYWSRYRNGVGFCLLGISRASGAPTKRRPSADRASSRLGDRVSRRGQKTPWKRL